jgi:hypothetical protein
MIDPKLPPITTGFEDLTGLDRLHGYTRIRDHSDLNTRHAETLCFVRL